MILIKMMRLLRLICVCLIVCDFVACQNDALIDPSIGRLKLHELACNRLAGHFRWSWLMDPIRDGATMKCFGFSTTRPEACERDLLCPLYARLVLDSHHDLFNVLLIRSLGQNSAYQLSIGLHSKYKVHRQLEFECHQNVTFITNRIALSTPENQVECIRSSSNWGLTVRNQDDYFICAASIPPVGRLQLRPPITRSDTLQRSVSTMHFDFDLLRSDSYLQVAITWPHLPHSLRLATEVSLRHWFDVSDDPTRMAQNMLCTRYHFVRLQVSPYNLSFWIVVAVACLLTFVTLTALVLLYLQRFQSYFITSRL